MQALGQLAGGVAHDFNNMLGGISGAAELLGFSLPKDSDLRDYHDMILKSTERAAGLTRKLLSFSRKQPLDMENIDIHQVIQDTVSLLKSSIDRRVSLKLNLLAEEAHVNGDASQLQSCILNLGINASHAMPNGGEITISTDIAALDESYCHSSSFEITAGRFVEIEVRDTGCGMPREIQNRIFEPFFTTKESDKGTGLGLAAVLGTIQQHYGAISVYSEVDVGTCFRLFLPLTTLNIITPTKATTLQRGQGTILVVDDDDIIRTTAHAMLKELGYKVIAAENGEKAIELYKEHRKKIDLVLLDMIMPVMNGHDCFHALKAINPAVKTVLSSGFSQPEMVDSMIRDGLCGTIQKPYLSAALSQTVKDALNCNCSNINCTPYAKG